MKTIVIAEIGCNHQGSMDKAKHLISVAAESGADMVKSQKRSMRLEWKYKPYNGVHSFAKEGGGETYWEHRKFLEFSEWQHIDLYTYAQKKGIEYFLSCWDMESAEFCIESFPSKYIKVPSACLTNYDMLDKLYRSDKKIILSTGMSEIIEIQLAVTYLAGHLEHVLLCTSSYPCDFADVRLGGLEALRKIRNEYAPEAGIGFSGHHQGIAIDIGAVALGCTMIERHFTIDRTWKGTDNAASLEPTGLGKLVRDIRAFEKANTGTLGVLECEQGARSKLRG